MDNQASERRQKSLNSDYAITASIAEDVVSRDAVAKRFIRVSTFVQFRSWDFLELGSYTVAN